MHIQKTIFDSEKLDFSLENELYLSTQIITYLGNKRSLLNFIGEKVEIVKKELNKSKISFFDVFAGSGIVSRYMKQHSHKIIANDLEDYCRILNLCYLDNKSNIDFDALKHYENFLKVKLAKGFKSGFFQEMYSPKLDTNIKLGERVFFTNENAKRIDTIRQLINEIPVELQNYFLAPLISEVSIKNNTSGVFKGFYKDSRTGIGEFGGSAKNALKRITGTIEIKLPIFSNFNTDFEVYQKDSNALVSDLGEVDLAYLDPPYNQHPYGSNYFMLNLLVNYQKPSEISEVSGIPKSWNRSVFNKSKEAQNAFEDLCINTKAKYLLISFNSEGFISKEQMIFMLNKIGNVRVFEKSYNTYRGSRNLKSRSTHVNEYLFLVKK